MSLFWKPNFEPLKITGSFLQSHWQDFPPANGWRSTYMQWGDFWVWKPWICFLRQFLMACTMVNHHFSPPFARIILGALSKHRGQAYPRLVGPPSSFLILQASKGRSGRWCWARAVDRWWCRGTAQDQLYIAMEFWSRKSSWDDWDHWMRFGHYDKTVVVKWKYVYTVSNVFSI